MTTSHATTLFMLTLTFVGACSSGGADQTTSAAKTPSATATVTATATATATASATATAEVDTGPTPVGVGKIVDLRVDLPADATKLAELDPKKAERVSIRPKDRAENLAFDVLSWWTTVPGNPGDRLVAGYAIDVTANPNKVNLRVLPQEVGGKTLELLFMAEWKNDRGNVAGWSLSGRVHGALFVAND